MATATPGPAPSRTARAYNPAFAYELAVIVEDGMRRMYCQAPADVFYYITLYNETYPMPPMPDGVSDGIIHGLYQYRPAAEQQAHRSQILASGTAMLAALQAQRMLSDEHDVAADVWSATSYKQLRDEALSAEWWNRLHPTNPTPRRPYVAEVLADANGPIVASHGLRQGGARPDSPMGPPTLHPAGHRRFRTLRHPHRPPPVLRSGRRPHRGGHPPRTGSERRTHG